MGSRLLFGLLGWFRVAVLIQFVCACLSIALGGLAVHLGEHEGGRFAVLLGLGELLFCGFELTLLTIWERGRAGR